MVALTSSLSLTASLEQEVVQQLSVKYNTEIQSTPTLILIGGFQGSGKSTLSERIRETFRANVVCADEIRGNLFGRGFVSSPEFAKLVIDIYHDTIKMLMERRTHIVIDAFAHSKRIQDVNELLTQTNVDYKIVKIFLKTSEETLRERVISRTPVPGRHTGVLNELEAALKTTEYNLDDYDLVVDTDVNDSDAVFKIVQEWLYAL